MKPLHLPDPSEGRFILKHMTGFFILFIMLCISAGGFVRAGVHDGSTASYQNRLIDHSTTPAKVTALEQRITASGGKDRQAITSLNSLASKTIFWRGVVQRFNRHSGYIWILILTPDNRYVWVYAKTSVRNLDFDRTGYTIGVKGNLVFDKNRLACIKARSVVLIAPPEDLSYRNFVQDYRIPDEFTVNTGKGPIRITHVHYSFILHRIYMHNPHYSWKTIETIGKAIVFFSYRYEVDPLLVTALINIESAFDHDAVSASGAVGLGQLMPSTAAGLGVNPKDPFQNVGGCVKYFQGNLRRWNNNREQVPLALACYNAGPGAVDRYGGIPPYSETRNYVFFITTLYQEYKKQYSESLENNVFLALPLSPAPCSSDELCVDR